MNLFNLKIGEGIHSHDHYDGFNFPKLFIKDIDTIYMQIAYLTNREKNERYWEFDIYY